MKPYLLLFFSLLYLPCRASALEVLDNFLNELKTVHAQFEQKQLSEKGKLLESSQGEFYLYRPGKFRWDYQKPYHQLIVADGEKVWVYDDDLEQVTVKDLQDTLGKTPALLLSSEKRVEDDFIVTVLPPQSNLTRLELKPRDAETQFDNIRLILQDKTLQKLELTDNLGQVTYITFHNIERNQELDMDLFIFTPPAGVDMIEEN